MGAGRRNLLRFDVSSLPAGATVQSASLTLYVTSRSNSNTMTAAVYPVLRYWNAGYATWATVDGSIAWTTAGCNGMGTDRSGTAAASVTFNVASGSVTTPDLTALVQGWVDAPASNYGVLLRPQGGAGIVNYYIASAQNATLAYRPKLTVTYTTGGTAMQAGMQ
jgi:hypothetical protein